MVTQMTNRLLATVTAVAVSGALTAHAAQGVHVTPPALLNQVASTARVALDPGAAAIRQEYQRDHDVLEHLRQEGSELQGSAHPQFNQVIAADQAQLLALEQAALAQIAADSSTNSAATITQMDALVTQAQAALTRFESQAGSTKINGQRP